MKFTKCGIVMLLVWPAGIAAAQQQTTTPAAQQAAAQKQDQKEQDPLVVAARRARKQKKEQPKAAKTWDNDNIPTTPDSISVVGESNSTDESRDKATSEKTASQSNSGAAAAEEKNEAGRNSAESGTIEQRRAGLRKQLAQAKERLQSVSTDLDILSRKYPLDQQMYYGKPDYSSDTEGAVKLKVEESQIDAKKQEVANAQKRVDDLTAQLKELEGEPAKPASNPQ